MDHNPLNDLSLKQIEIVTAYCEKNHISIESFIDEAIHEEEKRYLIRHQAEPGNQWMREILSRMVVWLWIIVLPIWWDMIDDYIPFLH